jgi:hypothetical protein
MVVADTIIDEKNGILQSQIRVKDKQIEQLERQIQPPVVSVGMRQLLDIQHTLVEVRPASRFYIHNNRFYRTSPPAEWRSIACNTRFSHSRNMQ